MPTYDYICPYCDHKCEMVHPINHGTPLMCTACNQAFMKRGPGGGLATHFKGTGFYETDYKGKS